VSVKRVMTAIRSGFDAKARTVEVRLLCGHEWTFHVHPDAGLPCFLACQACANVK
jgi:hypothetical protein